jgi:hypothetical protein
MNIFSKSQQKNKKVLLLISLLAFILICLIREQWQIKNLWSQVLILIVAYGLGIFLMFGDEKYLQNIYTEKLEEKVLITRSPLFLLTLPLLSIFMLTSTGSIAGMALILAINLVILIEIWQLAGQNQKFNQYFLTAVKKKVTNLEIKIIKIIFLLYFLILLFLLA